MNRMIVLLALVFLVGTAQAGNVYAAGGSVTGKISYEGTPPPPEHFTVSKNPEFCGAERDFFHITVKKGVVQGVAVLIENLDYKTGKFNKKGKGVSGKPMETNVATMIGENCAFLPFTGVVERLGKGKKGAPGLEITNNDTVIHNPHPFEVRGAARRSLWNKGLPEKGDKLNELLRVKKGNQVKIQCDQHDFMHAWLRVATNAYWTMAANDGSYKIDGIPAGKYNLVAWHPILGEQKTEVTVGDGGSAEASFTFSGSGRGR